MANFNEPVTSQPYVDHFAAIRDKDNDLAVMFDGTTSTNLPIGTIKINSGQGHRLEKWNGATWDAITAKLGTLDAALEGLTAVEIGWIGNLGSAPLEDDDLASNGGQVVQRSTVGVDPANTKRSVSTPDLNARTEMGFGRLPSGAVNAYPTRTSGDGLIQTQWGSDLRYQIGLSRSGAGEMWFRAEISDGDPNSWNPWHRVLNDDDFVSNGGSVVQENEAANFSDIVSFNGFGTSPTTGQNVMASFNGNVEFTNANGNNPIIRITDTPDLRIWDGGVHTMYVRGGGTTTGSPMLGDRGPGTLNAEALYDDGKPVARAPGSSSAVSLAFNTWRTPNATRPTLVIIRMRVFTDGSLSGKVRIDIDESGGTMADYSAASGLAHRNAGSGFNVEESATVYVPAGGSYRVRNAVDPVGTNSFFSHREFTL